MQITESIIHRIAKQKDTSGIDSVDIKPRKTTLPLDDKVISLGEEILKLYGKLNPGYGTLGQDPNVHHFPVHLGEYLAPAGIDFITFTNRTVGAIATAMSGQRFTTTSYPLFIRYNNQGRDWVLIAILKLKEGVGIDEETLDLNESLSFDIHDLREAARIDIQKWQDNEQPYLSFIKRGSGSDAESSRYFRTALACLDYIDSKHHTDAAMTALERYCGANNFTSDEKISARSAFYEYCSEKKTQGQPVNLTALSALINDQKPTAFIDYIREQDIEVNEIFSPNTSSYNKLQRIKKSFGTIKLGFDVNDLVTEQIMLDDDKSSVIITSPPRDLIESILEALGESELDDE